MLLTSFSYLEDPNDVKTLVRGLRIIDDIVKKEPMASRIDPAGNSYPDLHHDLSGKTHEELEKFVRETVNTLYHPACSARMAPLDDGGVVDPYLRVHGIPNLRIADASVFPSIVAGHTVSCLKYMMGA
jgi:choline dehydrogenase